MLNEGVVLEVNSKEAIVMSPDKGIVIIKSTPDMLVGKLIFFSDDQIFKANSNLVKLLSLGSAAAAIVLIAFLLFFKTSYQDQIYAYVDIDINPSLELAINKENKVLSVKAINEDANTLINDLDIKKKALDKAIINVIDESIADGYISKQKSDILFSAALAKKSEASESSAQLDKILNICRDTALKTTTFKSEVKTLNSTYQIKELANLSSTTIGRYHIYKKLSDTDSNVTLESIKSMNVQNLFKHIDKIILKQQVSISVPSTITTPKHTGAPAMSNVAKITTNNIQTPSARVTSQKSTPSSPTPSVIFTKEATPSVSKSAPTPSSKPTTIKNSNTSTNTINNTNTNNNTIINTNTIITSTPTKKPINSSNTIGSWNLKLTGDAKASYSFSDKKASITINNKGIENWDIAFTHPIESLVAEVKYRVSFKASALYNAKIYVKIGDIGQPYREFWNNNYNPFKIDANSPTFISQEFTPTQNSDSQIIAFHMGGDLAVTVPNTISIDDIVITKVTGSGTSTVLNYDFED